MNDAGTDWVSAHWANVPHPDPLGKPSRWSIAQIWILNPGPTQSRVRVRFFDIFGGLIFEDTPTAWRGHTLGVGAPDSGGNPGWCHISSEQPVVPWGLTGFLTNKDTGFVSMTFHAADPSLREYAPEPSRLGREESPDELADPGKDDSSRARRPTEGLLPRGRPADPSSTG